MLGKVSWNCPAGDALGAGESQPWPSSLSLRLWSVCTRQLGDVGAATSDMRFQTAQVHAGKFCFVVADGAWSPRIQKALISGVLRSGVSFLGHLSRLLHLLGPLCSTCGNLHILLTVFCKEVKLGGGSIVKSCPSRSQGPLLLLFKALLGTSQERHLTFQEINQEKRMPNPITEGMSRKGVQVPRGWPECGRLGGRHCRLLILGGSPSPS